MTAEKVGELTVDEYNKIIYDWNKTEASYPKNKTIHQLFEEQVEKTPENIAVVFENEELTYSELNEKANQLAHTIRKEYREHCGEVVKSDTFIGIYIERSLEMIIGILGILKSGAAYVPFDMADPEERLKFKINDCGCRMVLTSSESMKDLLFLTEIDTIPISIDSYWDEIIKNPKTNPEHINKSTDLAYIIYTSGSTGKPKGVMIEHKSVTRLVYNQNYIEIKEDDVFLQSSSPVFDASIFEIWGSLLNSSKLHLLETKDVFGSSDEFEKYLKYNKITILWLTVGLYNQFIKKNSTVFSSLKHLLVGGDVLNKEKILHLVDSANESGPRILTNGYGPTESTTFATTYSITNLIKNLPTIPIGKPLNNTIIYILDNNLHPVPVGVSGELHIGGDGLARGYLNRPELTSERFIPNPFATKKDKCRDHNIRIYKTGDICRWLPDGNIEFIGRNDDQVKIRGFRIELGEIENKLSSHPSVALCAVTARDINAEKFLCAYYTVEESSAVTSQTEIEKDLKINESFINSWESVYNDNYSSISEEICMDNFTGWENSYTESPIHLDEMREWRDAVIERILSLNPSSVCEIGSGSGLIMYPLLKSIDKYIGIDFSEEVINRLHKGIKKLKIDNTELYKGRADELNSILNPSGNSFKNLLIIINSVIQYFPNINYLEDVLNKSVDNISEGCVFIGDVRDFRLIKEFHASVEIYKHQQNIIHTDINLETTIEQYIRNEKELLISPEFFIKFADENSRISHVELLPKRGNGLNEMNKFRYDVILHVVPKKRVSFDKIDWTDYFLTISLEKHLLTGSKYFAVKNFPNKRVLCEDRIVKNLSENTEKVIAEYELLNDEITLIPGIEDLYELAEKFDYKLYVTLSIEDKSCYNLIFYKDNLYEFQLSTYNENCLKKLSDSFANNPAEENINQRILSSYELREYLSSLLPDYMIPAFFTELDKMPLNTSGKIDRKAFPEPELKVNKDIYEPPHTETEKKICMIWEKILYVENPGINESFFLLGGNSLKTVQLSLEINSEFGCSISASSLFSSKTVREQAHFVESVEKTAQLKIKRISDMPDYPILNAQKRMYLVNKLEENSTAYNIPLIYKIEDVLNNALLKESLLKIANAQVSLRSYFIETEKGIRQKILDVEEFDIEIEERILPIEEIQTALTAFVRPFEIGKAPLWRVGVYRESERNVTYLLFDFHHIIFDGRSVDIFLEELSKIFDKGMPQELEVRAVDYAAFEESFVETEEYRHQETYWLNELSGDLPTLTLPYDRRRPKIKSHNGSAVTLTVNKKIKEDMVVLENKEEITAFMIMFAAYNILLYKYSGNEDIITGAPSLGRNNTDIMSCIGMFVGTMPLRTNVNSTMTVREIFEQVKRKVLSAVSNNIYPLEEMVYRLNIERESGRNPLFDTMFAFLEICNEDISLGDYFCRHMDREVTTEQFDLTTYVYVKPEKTEIVFSYSTSLFDRNTIEQLSGHYINILETIVSKPGIMVKDIPVMDKDEYNKIVYDWNKTETSYLKNKTIHQLFEKQAEKTPDSTAVTFEGKNLTYSELNEKANQLAHTIRNEYKEQWGKDINSDTLIGIYIERSLEMIIGILGILKSGAAYVPFDNADPEVRLKFKINDCGCRMVITSSDSMKDLLFLAETDTIPLSIDSYWDEISKNSKANPEHINKSTDLAYVIYTSGSTGNPKGVMIEHRSVLNLLDALSNVYDYDGQNYKSTFFTSYVFDVSVSEIFTPLISGNELHIFSDHIKRLPEEIGNYINKNKINYLYLPPALLSVLPRENYESLKTVIYAGEICDKSTAEYWCKKKNIYNLYGPTEATVYSIGKLISEGEIEQIGRPISNTQVYILDTSLHPVPVGCSGELYIGGSGLARGYLNRPDLTSERFILNPFITEEDKKLGRNLRIYKTGDICSYLPDGNIEYIGRNDDQIKIRGFRIELGEIENKLSSFDGVNQTVVLCREKNSNNYLAGYYVAGNKLDEDAMRKYLSSVLPDYMIPSVFIHMDEFPLNTSGKIDRKKLPDPEFKGNEDNYAAPTSENEKQLCDIWQELLSIEKIGIKDDFFRVGGNSILAIKLVNLVNLKMNSDIKATDIFNHRNIADLTKLLQKMDTEFIYKDFQIDTISTDLYTPFELSNVQQAYYWGRSGDYELGNISTHGYEEYKFKYLDVKRLELALNKLVAHHIELRTVFNNGKQCFLKEHEYYKINTNTYSSKEEFLIIREKLSHKVFDVESFPLFEFSVSICEFPGDEKFYILHSGMDALLIDYTSTEIFYSELTHLYNHPDAVLNNLDITFKDYLDAVKKVRNSNMFDKAEKYWINKLPDYNLDYNFPLKENISNIKNPMFSRLTATIDIEKWNLIKEKVEKYGLGSTAIPLFAYGHVLTYWSNQRNFTVNLTLFNRLPLHEQVNDIFGDFTVLELFNYYVNNTNTTIKDILKFIHDGLWEDIENNIFDGVDFQRLIRAEYSVAVGSIISPVVLTSILGHNLGSSKFISDDFIAEDYSITQTSQIILDNKAYETTHGFVAEWDYVDQAFDTNTIEAMHSDYCRLIEFLAEADWEKDTILELEPPETVKTVINEANSSVQPIPEGTLSGVIENMITENNLFDNTAVIDVGTNKEYTYSELLNDTAKISNFILSDKLNSEENISKSILIGVLSEKGYNHAVSTMGIMKSGYAYLPLSIEWPSGRINEVLTEGKVCLLLISQKMSENKKLIESLKNYKLLIIEDVINSETTSVIKQPKVDADDIAYVIFTSGSTGKPKGVTISHRNAVNTIRAVNEKYRINANDKVLALSELSFDLSVYDMFGILAAGGTVVFPDQKLTKEPSHWVGLVNKHKITVWNTVPQLAGLFVEELSHKDNEYSDSLRLFLLSGDWIPLSLPEKIKKYYPQSQVVSLGGATEGSIWSIWYDIENIEKNWKSIPYGYAMPNQKMYVLNEYGSHCPFGVTGEIHIGGIGVALNYWMDEEKTAQSYINHPELGRLYRTGDLGKWNKEGYIEFCGRKDKQVKVNGYRIELEEISLQLKNIPGVDEALVTLQKEGNKHFIIGYLVTPHAEILDECNAADKTLKEIVEKYVKDYLPDYMLPYGYLTIDCIPLTPNGKLDTKKLPRFELNTQNTVYVPPRNETEEILCDIFKEIFDIDRVGVEDNFYEMGMNSISAMRIVSSISAKIGKIELKDLLQNNKICDLQSNIRISNYDDEEVL